MNIDTTLGGTIDEKARRRFEQAWHAGEQPHLEAFLPAVDARHFLNTLEELVVIDLEMRWRANHRSHDATDTGVEPPPAPLLEAYLGRFPQLSGPEILRRLANQEYRIRHIYGDKPTAQEYQQRFPDVVRTGSELDATLTTGASGVQAPPCVEGYEILGVLGRGGMAVVYKAWQKRLNRVVAIKTILGGGQGHSDDLVRFLHEAESVARLQHPHIIQIYEVNQVEGRPYFSMEFAASGSLADKLKQGAPLPPREAGQLLERISRAMEYAHGRGIVHRDLKPANVLLTEDGQPKVSDFGLAKHMEAGVGLTQTGAIIGTPSYMAPEQAAGQSALVGPASDIHALGSILYEMLTGRPPFQAAAIADALELVRTQEPVPPTRLQPKVPRDLETICLKCLQKEPARRYGTAGALADDLGRFLRDEPIHARPVGKIERLWRWRRRNPMVAGLTAAIALMLVAGIVVATLIALHLNRVALSEAAQRAEAQNQRIQAEEAHKETAKTLAEMYTGKGLIAHERGDPAEAFLWFAFCARLERNAPQTQLANRVRFRSWSRLLPLPLRALPHDEPVSHFAFHPKGTHLLTITRAGQLRIWDLDREETQSWNFKRPATSALWNADGTQLIVGSPDGAEIRSFPAGEKLHTLDLPGGVQSLALHRAGNWLALGGRTTRVWDLTKQGYVTPELKHQGAVLTVSFSPDADRLVTGCTDGKARLFALPGGDTDNSLALPHRVLKAGFSSVPMSPVFLKGGRELLTVLSDGEVGWWDAATGRKLQDVSFRTPGFGPLILALAGRPDQTHFAIGGYNGARIWDGETAEEHKAVLSHVNYVLAMDISADGRTLLTASEDRTCRLWSLADGQPLTAPLGHQASLRHAGFSPDGSRFVTVQNDGLVRVWATPRGHPHDHALPVAGTLTDVRIDGSGRFALASGAGWWDTAKNVQSTRVFEIVSGKPLGPELSIGGTLVNATLAPEAPQALTLCSLAPTRKERDAVRVNPEGRAGRVQFWDWRSGETQFQPLPMPSEPRGAIYSPDGKQAAVICMGGQIFVLDPATGAIVRRLEHGALGAQNSYPGVLFTADNKSLISWGSNPLVRVWDLETGAERYPALVHEGLTYHVALSGDERFLVSSGWDDTARIWDLSSGKSLAVLRHPEWLFSAWFDKSGNHVLTACRDGMARVWNWRTGALAHPPCRHKDALFNATFTPDEKFIVTACRDGTARLWERTTARQVAPPFVLRRGRWSLSAPTSEDRFSTTWNAAVAAEGRYAVVCGAGRTMYAVHLGDLADRPESDDPPLEDPVLLGELLSGMRVVEEREVEGLTTAQWLERWRTFRRRHPEFGKLLQ